jgi:hypothetical protein
MYTLKNAGPSYEWIGAGFTNVNISGLKNGAVDLSSNNWAYKVLPPTFFIFFWTNLYSRIRYEISHDDLI